MNFYDVVNSRRTIRDFSDQQVPSETLQRVLSAGMQAPSNDHLRNWEFVVVRGREEIESVVRQVPSNAQKQLQTILGSRQLDESQRKMYADAIPKQYQMLIDSGCLVLPFYKQNGELLQPKSLSSLNAFASAWCCIENILLAAAAEGLGCALRIPTSEEAEYVTEMVQAPLGYVLPCYISIGYPAAAAVLAEQEKIDIAERIHHGRW